MPLFDLDQKALIVAMDNKRTFGVTPGLEDPGSVIDDAVEAGADTVVVMAFIGIPVELETLRITAKVASQCWRSKLSLLVEALPCESERIPDPKAPDAMASAARLGFEHGADAIKSYYTGSPEGFRQVIQNCPAPVLIVGGPKMETGREVFQVVANAMQSGASGVVFGRNIWQSGNTRGTIKALRHIIHDNGSVDEAMEE